MYTENSLIDQTRSKSRSLIRGYTNRRPLAALAVLTLLLQTACVTNMSSPISESDKDTTRAFDGVWTAQVQRSAGTQLMPGNWLVRCNGKPREYNMRVEDGVVSYRRYAYKDGPIVVEKAFVSQEGSFYFNIPMKEKVNTKVKADTEDGAKLKDREVHPNMVLKGQSHIIYGNFVDAKGRDTYAYADFGNNGCTAVIKFVKKDTKSS